MQNCIVQMARLSVLSRIRARASTRQVVKGSQNRRKLSQTLELSSTKINFMAISFSQIVTDNMSTPQQFNQAHGHSLFDRSMTTPSLKQDFSQPVALQKIDTTESILVTFFRTSQA